MARNFRRHRTSHPVSELNVTNLIDVAFTLLIIFMLAAPLLESEQTIPVNLPVESKSEQMKPDPNDRFETITIQQDGTVKLGQRTVALSNLSGVLAPYAGEAKPPVFRIRADRDSTAQQFISVMDALKQNGLSRITFDTQIPR